MATNATQNKYAKRIMYSFLATFLNSSDDTGAYWQYFLYIYD